VIPNHMGIGDAGNAWWFDVLENGPSSPFARFFDIDWRPLKRELTEKVLLPILSEQYGRALEGQKIRIEYLAGKFQAVYDGRHPLPLAPRSWGRILRPVFERMRAELGAEDERVAELESILTALGHFPESTEHDAHRIAEGLREKEVVKRRLAV